MRNLLFYMMLLSFLLHVSCTREDTLRMPKSIEGEIPFDLTAMSEPPSFRWEDQQDSVWSMIYQGPPYQQKPERKPLN